MPEPFGPYVYVGLGNSLAFELGEVEPDYAGAIAALIIGEDERAKGVVTLRDLDSGDQEEVMRTGLVARLGPYLAAAGSE